MLVVLFRLAINCVTHEIKQKSEENLCAMCACVAVFEMRYVCDRLVSCYFLRVLECVLIWHTHPHSDKTNKYTICMYVINTCTGCMCVSYSQTSKITEKSPRKQKNADLPTRPTHTRHRHLDVAICYVVDDGFLFLTCCSFLQLLTINKKHNNYLLYFLRYRSMFECALLKTTTIRLYMFVSFCFERERKISADYFWKKLRKWNENWNSLSFCLFKQAHPKVCSGFFVLTFLLNLHSKK